MVPEHSSYYRHRTRGYLLRVYPAADGRAAHRALRFPKKSYFGGYFVTVTEEQLAEEFDRVKAIEVPEKLRVPGRA